MGGEVAGAGGACPPYPGDLKFSCQLKLAGLINWNSGSVMTLHKRRTDGIAFLALPGLRSLGERSSPH